MSNKLNHLLAGMNKQQEQAVLATEGPLLIMAGAGSGKTRVLTHRMAYILASELAKPWQILAITFTNKAAREMRERVGQLVGADAELMWLSTFHSMCARMLRRYAERLGYSQSFSIIDTSEQRVLMTRVLKEQNIDEKFLDYRTVLAHVSQAKNKLLTPDEYEAQFSGAVDERLFACYALYQRLLKQNNVMDFDDLIMLTVQLLQQHADVRQAYQEQFRYIHVDEYQDTNAAQYTLLRLLTNRDNNVCVVGDADQSIYGWRGADIRNILDFETDFPEARTILLEQNYRSTQTILNAANGVITNNNQRQEKQLWTENDKGQLIAYYRAQSAEDESRFVAEEIQRLLYKQEIASYDDVAVIYRTNALSRVVETTFTQHRIPHRLFGGTKFFDRMEVKDVLAYLRLLSNPMDDLSFERVVNVPKRGIGATSIEKLRDFARVHQLSLFEAAQQVMMTSVSARARAEITHFVTLIESLRGTMDDLSMVELTELVLEKTGYVTALQLQGTVEAEARIENVKELLTVAQQFDERELDDELPTLVAFLTDLALVSDSDDEVGEAQAQVNLMTMHAAKGLEFPVVFIIGLEKGLFPLHRAFESVNELEEERRLMYVAMTRAEKRLYFVNAYYRLLYGKPQNNAESQFITECPASFIMTVDANGNELSVFQPRTLTPYKTERRQAATRTPVEQATAQYVVGQKVAHNKWGVGMIVQVKGSGADQTIDVAFENQGIKHLMAAYAPITII